MRMLSATIVRLAGAIYLLTIASYWPEKIWWQQYCSTWWYF